MLKTGIIKMMCLFCILTGTLFSQSNSSYIFIPNKANFIAYNRSGVNYTISNSKLTQWKIQKSISRLSSGKRITMAADDPSGLAVAEKMDSVIKALKQESMNAQDYRNYLKFKEAAIAQNSELIKRIRLLAVKASNGILGPDDRDIIQSEVQMLIDDVDRRARFTQFNKKTVLKDVNSTSLGLNAIDLVHNPNGAIEICDTALNRLTVLRAKSGVESNVLSYQIKGKSYYMLNMLRSMSHITDADMAQEVSDLVNNGTVLQVQHGIMIQSKP